jgi:hypothetical protein
VQPGSVQEGELTWPAGLSAQVPTVDSTPAHGLGQQSRKPFPFDDGPDVQPCRAPTRIAVDPLS